MHPFSSFTAPVTVNEGAPTAAEEGVLIVFAVTAAAFGVGASARSSLLLSDFIFAFLAHVKIKRRRNVTS